MKRPSYPFAAIVGQRDLKRALLLAAVDWRLGVLLRGDKGAGKTTAARALAEILPDPSPFVNLPIGVTEDRLLGGIDLNSTLKGEPTFRSGLLAEANGGVFYVDEVNLLPDHLADALLDTAATGVNTMEREGFSAEQTAQFVLLGSMNPEEGSLRPQLLDRFALVVDVSATSEPSERREVVERRISYDHDPGAFSKRWADAQSEIHAQISAARSRLSSVVCGQEMLDRISSTVCDMGVRSLRADLAITRASCAQAALLGAKYVLEEHIDAVLHLALAHRVARSPRSQSPPPPSRTPKVPPSGDDSIPARNETEQQDRRFSSDALSMPTLPRISEDTGSGNFAARKGQAPGPVIRTRKAERPGELDVRSSVVEAITQHSDATLRPENLREKVREPLAASRFLFLVDSSGSHAARDRMRTVKGAALGLMEKSLHRRDEVAVIAFRGASAEILVEPTSDVEIVRAALEYLPTGGRTPLAHALELAESMVTPETFMILVTDGRANVASHTDNPWKDALDAATKFKCPALVIDTELTGNTIGKAKEIADAMNAEYVKVDTFEPGYDFSELVSERGNQAARRKS